MIKIRFVDPDAAEAQEKKSRLSVNNFENESAEDNTSNSGAAKPVHETARERAKREEKERKISELLAAESSQDSSGASPSAGSSESVILETAIPASERAWVRTLHWRANPFSENMPGSVHDFFVGRQDARAALGLIVRGEGRFGIIEGPRGTGTSSLITWLSEELSAHEGAFRLVSVRAPIDLAAFSKLLTDPYKGFLSTYKGTTPEDLALYLAKREKRRTVIIIDDADRMGPLEVTMREFLKHPNFVVVLAGREPARLREPNVLVTLSLLDHAASVECVRRRIASVGGSGTHPLGGELLTNLWQDSQGDLHLFFAACEQAAKEVALQPSKSKTEDDIVDTAHTRRNESLGEETAEPKKRSQFDSLIENLGESEASKQVKRK